MYQVVKYVWDTDRYYPCEVIAEYGDELTAWNVANGLDYGQSDYTAYRVDFVEPQSIAVTLPELAAVA